MDDHQAFAVHHIQLAMPPGGQARARAFYGEVLGLAEVPGPPALAARGGVWFRSGGLELHLGAEAGFRPARKAHPGILVTDLAALAARLTGHGTQVRPDQAYPGYQRLYAEDPFGNRLEFLQEEAGW